MKEKKRGVSGAIVLLVVAMLFGLGLWLLTAGTNKDQDWKLDKSAIGFEGLAPWLKSQGMDVRAANRRQTVKAEDFGFSVLPLFDVDLNSYDDRAKSPEERRAASTLRNVYEWQYYEKVNRIPAMVTLPKWRGVMVDPGVAHEQSLIDRSDLEVLKYQLGLGDIPIIRLGPEFTDWEPKYGQRVGLFHAQLFGREDVPSNCEEVIGLEAGALVLRCEFEYEEFFTWFLSDPDLLNNHGLAVAENAAFATALIADLSSQTRPGAIYVDYLSEITVLEEYDEERQDYVRGEDEFSRYFQYPFTLLWASLLIVTALIFWRGSRRFGPINEFGMAAQSVMRERTKRVSLGAKARLLRISGHDGRLVSDYVRAQTADLGRRIFGRDEGPRGTERALLMLARRDPELAELYAAVSQGLIENGPTMPPSQLAAQLAVYQSLRKEVMKIYGTF